MSLNGSSDLLRRALRERTERAQGTVPYFLRMAAARSADVEIADLSKLPVQIGEDDPLQDSASRFLFRFDYSVFGGGDVLK